MMGCQNRFHLTFLWVQFHRKIQHKQCPRVASRSKRPPNPVNRAEPPKRTRGDDYEDSALLSAHHHDLEKVS